MLQHFHRRQIVQKIHDFRNEQLLRAVNAQPHPQHIHNTMVVTHQGLLAFDRDPLGIVGDICAVRVRLGKPILLFRRVAKRLCIAHHIQNVSNGEVQSFQRNVQNVIKFVEHDAHADQPVPAELEFPNERIDTAEIGREQTVAVVSKKFHPHTAVHCCALFLVLGIEVVDQPAGHGAAAQFGSPVVHVVVCPRWHHRSTLCRHLSVGLAIRQNLLEVHKPRRGAAGALQTKVFVGPAVLVVLLARLEDLHGLRAGRLARLEQQRDHAAHHQRQL